MRKDDIVARYYALVKQLEEPAHKVVLGGDAALVLLGVRERAATIEAHVEENVLRWACSKGGRVVKDDPSRVVLDENLYLNSLFSDAGKVCVAGDVWVHSPHEMLLQCRQNLSSLQAEINRLEGLSQKSTFTAKRV